MDGGQDDGRPRRAWRWACLGIALMSLTAEPGCAARRWQRRDRLAMPSPYPMVPPSYYASAPRGPRPQASTRPADPRPQMTAVTPTPRPAQPGAPATPRPQMAAATPTPQPQPTPLPPPGPVPPLSPAPPPPGPVAAARSTRSTAPDPAATRTVAPAEPPVPDEDASAALAALVAEARKRLDTVGTYQARMVRQERVGNTLFPEEAVAVSIRRNPKAVRLEWPDGPQKGREVLYDPAHHGEVIHVNMAKAAIPLPRVSLPANDPMVSKNSRHPISEAGFDTVLANVEQALALRRKGDPAAGTLSYGGQLTPDGTSLPPCHMIDRVLPDGERWRVGLDAQTYFPVYVFATTPRGELLERYVFENVRVDPPVLTADDAFDPDKRWGSSATANLFGKLARAASAVSGNASAPSPSPR